MATRMLRNTGLRAATSTSLNRRALVVRASETPVEQPAAAAPQPEQPEVVVNNVSVAAPTAAPVAAAPKAVTFTGE
jgi:predicted lipid-binding transport protein (Tim44 family)